MCKAHELPTGTFLWMDDKMQRNETEFFAGLFRWSDGKATWPTGRPRPGGSGPLFDVEAWCPEHMAL